MLSAGCARGRNGKQNRARPAPALGGCSRSWQTASSWELPQRAEIACNTFLRVKAGLFVKEQSDLPESPPSEHVSLSSLGCVFHCVFLGCFLQFIRKKKKSRTVLEPLPSQLLSSSLTLYLPLLEDDGAYSSQSFLKLFLPLADTGLREGLCFLCPVLVCFSDIHEEQQRSSSLTSWQKQY